VAGAHEPRELEPRPIVGRPEHDDLGAGAGYADDGVEELALNEHPRAFNLETETDEERHHGVEARDRDTDVVETSNERHVVPPVVIVRSRWAQRRL